MTSPSAALVPGRSWTGLSRPFWLPRKEYAPALSGRGLCLPLPTVWLTLAATLAAASAPRRSSGTAESQGCPSLPYRPSLGPDHYIHCNSQHWQHQQDLRATPSAIATDLYQSRQTICQTISLSHLLALCIAAIYANLNARKMVAVRMAARAVEVLSPSRMVRMLRLAVKAHPAATDRALQPWVVRLPVSVMN
jgi:hypothetical protein